MICAEYDNGYQLREIAECLLPRVSRLYLLYAKVHSASKEIHRSEVLAR